MSALCIKRDDALASPIDDFYEHITRLIPLGEAERLADNDALGRALLLGLVSATELYFRQILAAMVNVCPLTRGHASKQMVPLGAVDYYGADVGFGLLDGVSLASKGELKRQTVRLTAIDFPNGSSVSQAVEEFEKLCEFRHAATHARGNLGHQNIRDLAIEAGGERLALRVLLDGLHESAGVCQNVVRAYNRFIFRRTVERWIAEGVLEASWAADRERFLALYQTFRSVRDGSGPASPYRAYLNLRPTLRKAVTEAASQSART